MSSAITPSLSVVVPTAHAEPALAGHLAVMLQQAREVGAEVILARSYSEELPGFSDFPELIQVEAPGASVLELCALGITHARAEIVATTEDHCRVGAGWCQAVLAAHRAEPSAAVISGVIENGATEIVGWAHFLLTNGSSLPPLRTGPLTIQPGRANLSYKRWVLPATFPDNAFIEMFFLRDLAARGVPLRQDATSVVTHDQPLDLTTALRYNFHNGRTIAGARLAWMRPVERGARTVACLILPAFLTLRAVKVMVRRNLLLDKLIVLLPLMFALGCAHAWGETAGYLRGSGRSPNGLH